jgi:hypothetical protein
MAHDPSARIFSRRLRASNSNSRGRDTGLLHERRGEKFTSGLLRVAV